MKLHAHKWLAWLLGIALLMPATPAMARGGGGGGHGGGGHGGGGHGGGGHGGGGFHGGGGGMRGFSGGGRSFSGGSARSFSGGSRSFSSGARNFSGSRNSSGNNFVNRNFGSQSRNFARTGSMNNLNRGSFAGNRNSFVSRNFGNTANRNFASSNFNRNFTGANFANRNFGNFNRNFAANHSWAGYPGFGRYGMGYRGWGGYGRFGFFPFWGLGWGWPWWWGLGYGGWGGYGWGGYGGYGGYYGNNYYGDNSVAYAAPTAPTTEQAQNAEQFIAQGEEAFRAGRYDAALHDWQHAMVDNPDNGGLVLLMAQTLFALGRYEDAAGAVQMAMQMLPESEWGNVVKNYTQLYDNIGNYTSELKALEKARDGKPDEPAYRFLLGYHFGYLGYPKQAVRELDKALDLQPKDLGSQKLRDIFAVQAGLPVRAPAAGQQSPGPSAPETPVPPTPQPPQTPTGAATGSPS